MKNILFVLALLFAVSYTACAQKTQSMRTSKVLIVYFSATGTTAHVAKKLADVTGGELYPIIPEKNYTNSDLDWNDKQSRSSIEMTDLTARPIMKTVQLDLKNYDVIFIGYPIWWGVAPRIINTFIETHDLKGKRLIPFATSGGSSINQSVIALKQSYPNLHWESGRLFNRISGNEIEKWVKNLDL